MSGPNGAQPGVAAPRTKRVARRPPSAVLGEARLADAGLAAEQQQRAAPAGAGSAARARPLEPRVDQRRVTADLERRRGRDAARTAATAAAVASARRSRSDGQLARAGAVEHRRDLGDEVGREAAAARVLEDVLGALGLVDAVDLVAGDVAVAPRVRALSASATTSLDFVRDPAQLVVGELARAGDLALDDVGGHGVLLLVGCWRRDDGTTARVARHRQDCRTFAGPLPYRRSGLRWLSWGAPSGSTAGSRPAA